MDKAKRPTGEMLNRNKDNITQNIQDLFVFCIVFKVTELKTDIYLVPKFMGGKSRENFPLP